MMRNYVTIFYSNYLAKGLSLYYSLSKVSENSYLYIVAMDDECEKILDGSALDKARIISLKDLESYYPSLLEAKKDRGKGEYSWTCKGPAVLYCIEKFGLEDCTYLDSDLFFFSNPEPLFAEDEKCDVILTPHRYTERYDLSESNGKYCAQFMSFKSTENGLRILKWWSEECIKWCYGRHEKGRFGDQKYLDFFQEKFGGVHDSENAGVCAPWNIQQYKVERNSEGVYVDNGKQRSPLVFYHFHFLKNQDFGKYNELLLGPYKLNRAVREYIYKPYIQGLKRVTKEVDNKYSTDVMASRKVSMSTLRLLMHVAKNILDSNKQIWKRR